MKTKKNEALESYLKTENEYWNEFAFKLLCEAIQKGIFENPEIPLQIINDSIDIFCDNHTQPIKAVEVFEASLLKHELNPQQKTFIYHYTCRYLNESDFDNVNLIPAHDLLISKNEKLKSESKHLNAVTNNIRDTLKEMMQKEIESLPETLKELEPIQRLNILCKLIPFVLPKVESVHHKEGEYSENSFKRLDW